MVSQTQPGSTTPARRPRVLFVNQYYWPDMASTAQHLADLAESLAEAGYDCHVLAGRGSYGVEDTRRSLTSRETHHGVAIHRIQTSSFGRGSVLRRMIDYLSFFAGAIVMAWRVPRPDLVVTLTTPPLIGLIGTMLKRLRGVRHIAWCMDLHPDASLALGRMQAEGLMVRWLDAIATTILRQADRVVALGPYMKQRIVEKRIASDRIETIGVWTRADEVMPRSRIDHPLRCRWGLNDRFVVMYSGNLGLAHRFEEVIAAAETLRNRPEIIWLFVGGGPRLEEVRETARDRALTNIQFRGYVPRDQLHLSLTVADAHLITMRSEMVGIVVPGKLYGAMASGRPCLFVGPNRSETADAIRAAGCGAVIEPGDVTGLSDAVRYLSENPNEATRQGRAARQGFERHHERSISCRAWNQLMSEMIRSSYVSENINDRSEVSQPVT